MTPSERWRWAKHNRIARQAQLLDAMDAVEEAEMEWHYARFIHVAASEECPTCHTPAGAYCALFQAPDGTYTWSPKAFARDLRVRLVALGLHPARTTTPEALEAAR